MRRPPVFHDGSILFKGDTCEPLENAALAGEVHFKALARAHYPGYPIKKDHLEGLCSVGYWDALKTQTWGLPWHQNEGIEITYLHRGNLYFSVENHHVDLQKNWATITKPWERHRVGNPQVTPSKLFWLILDVQVRRPHDPWIWPSWILLSEQEKLFLRNFLDQPNQPTFLAPPDLAQAFQKIALCLDEGEPQIFESKVKLCINEIFLSLCHDIKEPEFQRNDDSDRQKTVAIFLKHLKEFPQSPWSLEEMAQECGLGKSQFVKYIRDLTNMSPMDFLQQCRLDFACQMMTRESNISLTQVALDSGFSSSGYFSTVFKKFKGLSPREFMKSTHKTF